MKKNVISDDFAGKTLLEYIHSVCPHLSDGDIKKMIKKDDIKVNGQKTSMGMTVSCDDVIEIYNDGASGKGELEIVYEDRNYIIVNKKPGIYTVVAGEHPEADLTDLINDYMKSKNEYIEETGNVAHACHKLDIYTGGLSLFAKSGEMFGHIFEAVRQRRVSFVFNAIICGAPEVGTEIQLKSFINENTGKPFVRISDKQKFGDKAAAMRIRVVASNGEVSLIECLPISMLRHQIRAQLSLEGWPVLGDAVYGNKKLNKKYIAKYQALWCTGVKFFTGSNNVLSYLDGMTVTTDNIIFPYVSFADNPDNAGTKPEAETQTRRKIAPPL